MPLLDHPGSSLSRQGSPPFGVGEESQAHRGKRLGLTGRKGQPRLVVTNDLGHGRHVAAHDRASHRHRLERLERRGECGRPGQEPWVDHDVGPGIDAGDVCVRQPAGKRHVPLDAERANQRAQPALDVMIVPSGGTDDQQLHVRARGDDRRQRSHQHVQPFVRLERTDVCHDAACGRGISGASRVVRAQGELLHVDTVLDHRQARLVGHARFELAAQRFADRHHGVSPAQVHRSRRAWPAGRTASGGRTCRGRRRRSPTGRAPRKRMASRGHGRREGPAARRAPASARE